MMRILSGAAAKARVKRIAARGSRYAEVEPAVRRIINDVRRQGDRAVRKYAERWDGLLPGTPLPVFEQEIEAAWNSASPELQGFVASRGSQYSPLLRMAKANGVEAHAAGNHRRTSRAAPGFRWVLHSGRALPVGLHLAYDRHPRAGCGCAEYPRCLTSARVGFACGCRNARSARSLSRRRGAGHRGARLWNAWHSPRGENRRTGKSLRHRRQEAGVL